MTVFLKNNMKITLACIVGNEEAVIERFIRSFAPAVDSFVFVHAIGSLDADRTSEIIKATCNELDKDFTESDYQNKQDFPHVDDFGAARQGSWELASIFEVADYILWADADDVLSEDAAKAIRVAAESNLHDVFIMPYHVRGDKQIVMRERMVKASIGSFWKYPVHEQLAFPNDASYKIIKDAVFIHSPLHTKSGGHERNLTILKSETADVWRNFFYLAQEYFQAGDERRFIINAKACLAIPGCGELERYELLLNLAQTPKQDSRALAAEAFAIMPDRREALALLCNYALIDGVHAKALRFSSMMIETEQPKRTYWSQNNEWYGWKGAELQRQCLRLNGENEEADVEFELNTDESRPIISVIHEVKDCAITALQIRELWFSNARHPENVDFIFSGNQLPMIKGFRFTENSDTKAAIGSIIVHSKDGDLPLMGWDEIKASESVISKPRKETVTA